MIDLHTHSVFSDGELIPAELIRRASVLGYTAIAITDHVDFTNIEHTISSLKEVTSIKDEYDMDIFVGVELTHVPPAKLHKLVGIARKLGAEIIVVHGETTVEPVAQGTNHAALLLDIDILAHPGMITIEDAMLAKDSGICLEITCRCGHNRTNGHVARIAKETGTGLIVNTDAHAPWDLVNDETAFKVAMGAGLDETEAKKATGSQPLNLLKSIK
jgi:histidinol phosphatase-like PHP family hydrolase